MKTINTVKFFATVALILTMLATSCSSSEEKDPEPVKPEVKESNLKGVWSVTVGDYHVVVELKQDKEGKVFIQDATINGAKASFQLVEAIDDNIAQIILNKDQVVFNSITYVGADGLFVAYTFTDAGSNLYEGIALKK